MVTKNRLEKTLKFVLVTECTHEDGLLDYGVDYEEPSEEDIVCMAVKILERNPELAAKVLGNEKYELEAKPLTVDRLKKAYSL